MKKTLIALGCLMAAVVATYGQGQIQFNNVLVNAPILNVDGTAVPAGTDYLAQLYAGVQGTAEENLAAVGSPAGFFIPGFIASPAQAVVIPGVAANAVATVQVRAWFTDGGTITSWESAIIRGESNLLASPPLGGGPVTPPTLDGLQGFQLEVIPEPSTIALAVLGAAALLFARRRN